MKAIIFCISLILLSGCQPAENQASSGVPMRVDWGKVTKLEFQRAGKSSAYFKVTTDKFIFEELDITDFPGKKIEIGDQISMLEWVSKKEVSVQYCKANTCISYAICFSWQPCFEEYEIKYPDLLKD